MSEEDYFDSVQLRENRLLERLFDEAMTTHQRNADTAAIDNDRQRLEAAIARRTLRIFYERCLAPSEPKD